MNKQEFLMRLRKELSGLPKDDIEERLTFYGEIIDDRMEEGLSEEEAVSAVGSVGEIASQIIADFSFAKIAGDRIKPKRHLKAWEIILLALGSPLWLSLAVAVLAVILSLYVSLWAGIVSLWAVFASVAACAVAGVACAIAADANAVIAILGAGITCAGVAVFMFYGCKAATKGILMITRLIALWIKKGLIKKGEA